MSCFRRRRDQARKSWRDSRKRRYWQMLDSSVRIISIVYRKYRMNLTSSRL